jgi:branched-subunit amino acid aminotransferase/4-amino-4-deoxychorismate lyase
MAEHPIMLDETLDRLEESLKRLHTKPDNRRRWTRQAIERLRVSELAAEYLLVRYAGGNEKLWKEAQEFAITELRKAGKIR